MAKSKKGRNPKVQYNDINATMICTAGSTPIGFQAHPFKKLSYNLPYKTEQKINLVVALRIKWIGKSN